MLCCINTLLCLQFESVSLKRHFKLHVHVDLCVCSESESELNVSHTHTNSAHWAEFAWDVTKFKHCESFFWNIALKWYERTVRSCRWMGKIRVLCGRSSTSYILTHILLALHCHYSVTENWIYNHWIHWVVSCRETRASSPDILDVHLTRYMIILRNDNNYSFDQIDFYWRIINRTKSTRDLIFCFCWIKLFIQ